LGHLSGSNKGISWCRSVTPAVKGEMAQILKDATDKKAGASKRSSDAAANTTGLATSAAAVAASKRSRASLSSGPVVGPSGIAAAFKRQGDISADARATMALVDMIHSEGLSADFAQKRKVVAARWWRLSRRSRPRPRTTRPPAISRSTARSSTPSPGSTTPTP